MDPKDEILSNHCDDFINKTINIIDLVLTMVSSETDTSVISRVSP
jgi:hypothetical protein